MQNVRTGKILIGDTNNIGYKRVCLYMPHKKRFFIHRLVAYHFCDGYCEGLVVNHKDGNKLNNIADNLEWVTRSENDIHAFKLKLRKSYPRKYKYGILAYDKDTLELKKEYKNIKECEEDLHIARSWIYTCCKDNKKNL